MSPKHLTLKVLLALTLATAPAAAAELPSFDMEEIIVTADAYQPAVHTDTVSIKQVNPAKATSIPDLLRQATGIDIQRRSPHDNQDGTVSLRGFDARRFTVLVDGRPVNMSGVMGGSYMDWNSIPLERVEKIQIIKGAKAAAYGNTLGGVINIITKDYTQASGQLTFGSGENGIYQRRFNYGAGSGRFSWSLYGNQFGNDAFLRNNDYDADQYGLALKYHLTDKDSIKFDWNKAKEKRGMIIRNDPTEALPHVYDPKYPVISATDEEKFSPGGPGVAVVPNPGAYSEKNLTTHSTTWNHQTRDGHFALSYWENKEERRDVNFDNTGTINLDRTVIADKSSGWLLNGQETRNGHTYGYGLEYKQYRYGYGAYKVGSGSLVPSQKVNLLGGYLDDTWAINDRWTGNIGLRYDKMEGRPDANAAIKPIDANSISPKLNFSFRNNKDTMTFLSINHLWRSPSMAELYWWSTNKTTPTSGSVVKSGDLKPESGWGYEIGIEHKLSPAFTTKLTAYYQDIDDYIHFTHQAPFSCYNIENAELWGFEWENNYQLDPHSRFFFNYTNQHTRKNGVDPGDQLGLRNELDYRPRHKVTVGYHYDAQPWQFWYTVQYAGEQTANYPFGSGNTLSLGGYTTHAVSLTREWNSGSSLTLTVDNIFDKYYVERNNYPMPGRLVSAIFKQKI